MTHYSKQIKANQRGSRPPLFAAQLGTTASRLPGIAKDHSSIRRLAMHLGCAPCAVKHAISVLSKVDRHSRTLIRPKVAIPRGGWKPSSHYEQIKRGFSPPFIRLGPHTVAIPEYEIDAINSARIAGWDNVNIAVLVKILIAFRAEQCAGPVTDAIAHYENVFSSYEGASK